MKTYIFISTSLLLAACTDTSHKPLALDDNFGRAYRQIKQAQILNPYAAKYPPLPVRQMEGDVGREVMDGYRKSFRKAEEVKEVNINIGGTSGSSSN